MKARLIDITDKDLSEMVKKELEIEDKDLLKIRRDNISTTLFWSTSNRKGYVVVLEKTIAFVDGMWGCSVRYLSGVGVDFLIERGYDLGKGFYYDRDL